MHWQVTVVDLHDSRDGDPLADVREFLREKWEPFAATATVLWFRRQVEDSDASDADADFLASLGIPPAGPK